MKHNPPHDFRYIPKKAPRLQAVYQDAVHLLRETQNAVRGQFTFQYRPVGSYDRDMVTYDEASNVGYDLDFDLIVNAAEDTYTAKEIKKALQHAMNQTAGWHGYDFPEDSRRVLTMKCKDRKRARILHSIDFAITREVVDEYGRRRREVIHFDKKTRRYLWCRQPCWESGLRDRIARLKQAGLWEELKIYYLGKKNKNDNPDLHSRQLFSMAVNELCQRYGLMESERNDPSSARSRTPDAPPNPGTSHGIFSLI